MKYVENMPQLKLSLPIYAVYNGMRQYKFHVHILTHVLKTQ
jgi:hypothetical protein